VEPLPPGRFRSQGYIEELSKLLKLVRLSSKCGTYLRFGEEH